ncbi:MAG TPA: succinate dehydrogenase cytochrome b subunit [Candidatus Eremiobacteraceae bacterium]|nr:succinate dehydrogenase cytochrome b subunit [Candidatus Eremiobacteraceae bacterium]
MSATAVNVAISPLRFWQTTVGKKAVMAITGAMLFIFILGHLAGNLQVFESPEKINRYAAFLKSVPALLWSARIILLLAVVLHIWSSFELWLLQRQARPVKYVKKQNIHSTYASRTMMWSGPIILAFVIWHLLQFTFGAVHPGAPFSEENVYNNVVLGFQVWPVSLFYIIAMTMLCYHLYHGLWSMFQSLGINHPVYTPWIQVLAKVVAIVIAIGYISIPVAVLAGFLKPV